MSLTDYNQQLVIRGARSFQPITPSDVTILTNDIRGLYIGTGGSLVIEGDDGDVETLTNLADSTVYPFSGRRILAATTCAGIVGLK